MTAEAGFALLPDALFDGVSLLQDHALPVRNGRTGRIMPRHGLPPDMPLRRIAGKLTPGYLDLQVNGGGDRLLNNEQSPEALAIMAAAHRRFGTVGILPTVITDAPEVLARAVDAVLTARGKRGLLGLHIEGPHISLARRGTHAAEWVRPFEDATLAHVRRLRSAGIFVMITLAPEAVSPAQVRALAETGAVVSIGHSDATAEAVNALIEAGATCFTHLYNAMSPMLNRAPGVTGACINSTAYAGIICDGIHVADDMIRLAIRARPVPGRMFLVSDAMSTVGGSDGFVLYGRDVRLVDGALVNQDGSLAGAHVTMAQSVSRLIGKLGIAPAQALDMAVSAPARLLGRPELASPEDRDASDLLLLDENWQVMGALA